MPIKQKLLKRTFIALKTATNTRYFYRSQIVQNILQVNNFLYQ